MSPEIGSVVEIRCQSKVTFRHIPGNTSFPSLSLSRYRCLEGRQHSLETLTVRCRSARMHRIRQWSCKILVHIHAIIPFRRNKSQQAPTDTLNA